MKEGDWLSLDGSTGEVLPRPGQNHGRRIPARRIFAKFMSWADEFRGKFGVRANADIPRDAKVARKFGAEGIGLCRTEHMFFAEDRIPHVQAMILARDEKTRRKALLKLLPMQRKDFAGLFKAMDGFPVVIRTLDPPLHEFLPKREELMVDIAKLPHADIKAKKEMSASYKHSGAGELKNAAARTAEARGRAARVQPDAGPSRLPSGHHVSGDHRNAGARHLRSGRAGGEEGRQGHSRSHDSADRRRQGTRDTRRRSWSQVAEEVLGKAGMKDLHYMVGTMIEIPRAALTADQVAKEAEFFSFGTNDLTQTTMGLSRDDYTKFQKDYEKAKIFANDPFARARPGRRRQAGRDGGRAAAARRGRTWKSASAASTAASRVRCSSAIAWAWITYPARPYRVPIARLAAAQAAISGDKSEAMRTA